MKCIVLSTPYIIDLFIFYILITSIWTLVGYKLISDLDGEVEYDEYLNNFDDYLRALNAMYVLISFDGYPDIMLSALRNKYLRKNLLRINNKIICRTKLCLSDFLCAIYHGIPNNFYSYTCGNHFRKLQGGLTIFWKKLINFIK
jgi:hypothetical protein